MVTHRVNVFGAEPRAPLGALAGSCAQLVSELTKSCREMRMTLDTGQRQDTPGP